MLEADAVSIRRGAALLLDQVTMHIAAGEIVAIVGPNGAGKSTLLRALAGLEPPAAGRVVIDNEPLAALRPEHRARRIAYLPQERRIEWALSVRQIVELARTADRHITDDVLDAAMVEAGIAHLADRTVETLSGGEQARVLFARALAVNADYVLADEPVMALDPRHQLSLMASLRRVARQGAGVAVSLHDLTHVARFADRVVLLDRGRLAATGSVAQVLTAARIADIYAVDILDATHQTERYIMPWRIRPD